MGQYFILVNLDKKEYVETNILKLWEWCANNEARLLPWLLAKGPQSGTELCNFDPEMQKATEIYLNSKDKEERTKALETINKIASTPIGRGYFSTCGRWSGDRIVLVGDYDESGLYGIAKKEYKNITVDVVREFNEFIEDSRLKVYMVVKDERL
ncbi:MAG: hypothetical protein QW253_00015 [Metallosphaera sp.]